MPAWSWLLIGFFFFGGLGLAVWEETSWIGIGQIWMGVAVLVALINLGVSGKIGKKLGSKMGGSGTAASTGAGPGAPAPPGDTAEQLARLERLRQRGDLSDAEYRSQRERILAQA